jgi:ATP-dependent exoDNAse (exonuclease V) alpha subunit
VLAFHKAVKGIAAKNESIEVVTVTKHALTARRANGQAVHITSKRTKAFAVFEPQEIEVSAGDKLLLQANWRDKKFRATNGELVTVAAVTPESIRLEDGRELPANYRQFTHGYAVTAHRSQGKTVDFEIIAAERMAQDLFYVSATRAREGLTVITSDSAGLQESIGISGDRQSASELARHANVSSPSRSMSEDDLIQAYQAMSKKPAQQQQVHKEMTQHVNHTRTRISMGL